MFHCVRNILAAGTLAILAFNAVAHGQATIWQDNFDSYSTGAFPSTGGWVLQTNGFGTSYQATDNSHFFSTTQSLKLEGACNWASQASRALPTTSNRMRLEVYVRLDSIETRCLAYQDEIIAFQNSGQPASTIIGVAFVDGTIESVPYQYGHWYKVRIDLDNMTETYSAWLDCQPLFVDRSFAGVPHPDQILLTAHNARHTRAWYDDVKVTDITPAFEDNFDAYAASTFPSSGGWVLLTNGYGNAYQVVDSGTAVSMPKSMKLEGACGWASQAYRVITWTSPVMRLTANIRLDSLENACLPYQDALVGFVNHNTPANTICGIGVQGKMANGVVPVSYNEWHTIAVDIDTVAKTQTGWLDGQLAFSNQPLPLPLPDAVYITAHNSRHTRVRYDNIAVTDVSCEPVVQPLEPGAPFCSDVNSNATIQADWNTVFGKQFSVVSPVILNGSNVLKFEGFDNGCHTDIMKRGFSASTGEYCCEFLQIRNASAGLHGMWAAVQPGTNPHPDFRACYVLRVNAANSANGGFVSLSRQGDGGAYVDGAQVPSTFDTGEWINVFLRIYPGGHVVGGYELNGVVTSVSLNDPNPLPTGAFYVGSCVDGSDPANYVDDICFSPNLPPVDSLFFPSVTVAPPCDSSTSLQPVMIALSKPAKAGVVTFKIPTGVTVTGVTKSAKTSAWDVDYHPQTGYAFVVLTNQSGLRLPADTSTLFSVKYKATRSCTDEYVMWDTAQSGDPSRRTAFTDTLQATFLPEFDRLRDTSTVDAIVPGNMDGQGSPDISDLSILIDYLYVSFTPPCQMAAANFVSDFPGTVCDANIDISDLSSLIDYLYISFTPLRCCPLAVANKLEALSESPDYAVSISSESGLSNVSLSATNSARGIQLDLSGPVGEMPISLAGDNLTVYSGWKDGVLHVGIIDPTGKQFINAGNTPLIQLNGEFKILSATVADMDHRSIRPQIGSTAGTTLPTEYTLSQNYPNPFNPATTISFSLPVAGHVTVKVYNAIGQEVATLVNEDRPAGVHQVLWDANKFASGVYLYRLTTDGFSETKKMLLMK